MEVTTKEKISEICLVIAERCSINDTRDKYYLKDGATALPVMIGDVLDWMDGQEEYANLYNRLTFIRTEKRKPIEHQHDLVIDFVYSLLPTDA